MTVNPQLLKRLEQLVWWLIYGGLFAVVLGLFLVRQGEPQALCWLWGGGGAVILGVLLVLLRANLGAGPSDGPRDGGPPTA